MPALICEEIISVCGFDWNIIKLLSVGTNYVELLNSGTQFDIFLDNRDHLYNRQFDRKNEALYR